MAMTTDERQALIERLRAKEAQIRRVGTAAADHHNEDIQNAGKSHLRFADDIRDILVLAHANGWHDIAGALKEAEAETARTIADIVGARASDMMGTAHPRFDEESRKEIARLEALISRIRAASLIAEQREGK
jgi:hypothetical protein